MIVRMNVFVREEGFGCIPELFVAYHMHRGNRCEILLFVFLARFSLFSTKKRGHFRHLFLILDLSLIALFICLAIKGVLFPQTLFGCIGAYLSSTSLKTDEKAAKDSSR